VSDERADNGFQTMATPNKSQLSPHAVIGVFVALLGVLFTLDNLHLLQVDHLLRFWPIAPIGVGLLVLMQADSPGEWWKGSFWLAAGSLFMARSLGYLPFSPWDLWPLFLVLVGIKMMWNAKSSASCQDWRGPRGKRLERMARRRQKWASRMQQRGDDFHDWSSTFGGGPSSSPPDWTHDPHSSFAPGATPGPGVEPPPLPDLDPLPGLDDEEAEGASAGAGAGAAAGAGAQSRAGGATRSYAEAESRVTLFALMSGVKRKFAGIFRGAQLTAIMGGIELDLRGAKVEDGAVIDALAFWGGIEIFVPENWAVVNQGHALMGGFDDSTRHPDPGERPRLIVRGLALMGAVEIKPKPRDSWWKGKS
jgi:hypothetical protein